MKKFENLINLEEAQDVIKKEIAVLFYFSTQSCSVGEALQPKVLNLVNTSFPNLLLYNVDLNLSPEISAHFNAFVEPTVLVFFDGKETIRKSRNIGVFELEDAIKRPYQLIFE